MRLTDLDWNPSTRKLRQFAGLWLVILGALALWHGWWHERHVLGTVLAMAALAVGLVGLAKPTAVRWIFVGSTMVALPIGWLVSHVLLALVYYALFTPLAIVFRLVGRDLLRLRSPTDADTLWQPRRPPMDTRRYFRQY
jgi:hypothetical protein